MDYFMFIIKLTVECKYWIFIARIPQSIPGYRLAMSVGPSVNILIKHFLQNLGNSKEVQTKYFA